DRHFSESEQRRLSADVDWWRQREAALAALGCCADDFVDLIEGRIEDGDQPLQLNVSNVLTNYVIPGIEMRDCPLLCGTCLWLMARLTPILPKEYREKLILISLQYISSEQDMFVRVCVVRALF
uniref:Uncharacterized protein n=1 Tax=Plectus sambesii TaxID=2011161 RepID=A0A914VEC0_9BILA